MRFAQALANGIYMTPNATAKMLFRHEIVSGVYVLRKIAAETWGAYAVAQGSIPEPYVTRRETVEQSVADGGGGRLVDVARLPILRRWRVDSRARLPASVRLAARSCCRHVRTRDQASEE